MPLVFFVVGDCGDGGTGRGKGVEGRLGWRMRDWKKEREAEWGSEIRTDVE